MMGPGSLSQIPYLITPVQKSTGLGWPFEAALQCAEPSVYLTCCCYSDWYSLRCQVDMEILGIEPGSFTQCCVDWGPFHTDLSPLPFPGYSSVAIATFVTVQMTL